MSICSSAARAVSWTLSHLPWRADHIRDINKRMFKSGAPWLFNSDTPVSWWMSFLKCPFLYYLIMCMNIFFWVCVWLFSLWICTCECSTGRLHKRELDPLELAILNRQLCAGTPVQKPSLQLLKKPLFEWNSLIISGSHRIILLKMFLNIPLVLQTLKSLSSSHELK